MSNSLLLSIIIVNWNTRQLTVDCLQAVQADLAISQLAASEVFVVDNHSSDDSVAVLRSQFPWVKLIVNEENVGFACANNQAMRQAGGRFVLLLNSDTLLQPGALRALIAFLQATPDAGVAGARLLNPDGSLQHSCYRVPTLGGELWRLLHLDKLWPLALYDMSQWPLDRPRPVEVVQGAAMLLRRAVIDEVGGLDEDYFMYTEEVDWCDRILLAGWQIYWVPAARVIHFGGQSTQQVAQAMFLRLYESKILFFRKHRGALPTTFYKAILAITALPRLIAAPLALLEGGLARQRHWRIANHYWHLLRELPGL